MWAERVDGSPCRVQATPVSLHKAHAGLLALAPVSPPHLREGGAPLTDGGRPLSVPRFQLLCGLSLPNNTKATRALLAQQGSAGQGKIILIHQALFDV